MATGSQEAAAEWVEIVAISELFRLIALNKDANGALIRATGKN
jgi:hypothetical protein